MSAQPAEQPLAAQSPGDVTAFRLGFRAAFEPPPDEGGEAGETTTTLVSWWNHLECETCGHTFRRGDRVVLDPQTSRVAHLDPALRCAVVPAADSEEPEAGAPEVSAGASDLADFANGLDLTWPPAGDLPVTRLAPDDWRTIRPRPPLERVRCLYCGHTFREGEHVIVCPCSADEPVCGAAVHRDPAAGLICWESWQPTGKVRRCPITFGRPPQLPGVSDGR